LAALGERYKLPHRRPGRISGRKRISDHFPAKKKRIWSLVAVILPLNGAKKIIPK